MPEKHSHCSYCGRRFPSATPWPRTCPGCGTKSYLNPIPVVVVLVPLGDGLVVVRRNIEPSRGTLTLPGGYVDLGESWQEAGIREVLEETGITITAEELTLYDVANGLDDTLVIFGLAAPRPEGHLQPFSSKETREVALIAGPTELGFPMHTKVVARYFAQRDGKAP